MRELTVVTAIDAEFVAVYEEDKLVFWGTGDATDMPDPKLLTNLGFKVDYLELCDAQDVPDEPMDSLQGLLEASTDGWSIETIRPDVADPSLPAPELNYCFMRLETPDEGVPGDLLLVAVPLIKGTDNTEYRFRFASQENAMTFLEDEVQFLLNQDELEDEDRAKLEEVKTWLLVEERLTPISRPFEQLKIPQDEEEEE